MFAPKLKSILLPQFTDTLNIYPSPLYQVSNANWSAFLKGILPTLQSHGWKNGTHGGANWTVGTCICSHWLCGPLECYWPLCGRHGCSWSVPRGGFCLLPPHPPLPIPPYPTPPRLPSHPPPLLSILTAERDGKKYLEIQPSETEKVSYNRKQ